MVEIHGSVQARFGTVKDAFAANFADGAELGARFSLVEGGEVVADLWAGHADRKLTRPFDDATLTPVFSVTKAVAAMVVARAVERGELAYDWPVARLWPEFAANGKAQVTVGQVLSHQAGLPGFPDRMEPALWFDWDAICARLAAMEPLWAPGTASGYHPITFGYLVGEIHARACGRSLGSALREDLTGPLGLDLWIGLPEAEDHRVAEMQLPPAAPDFGEAGPPARAAFLTPWAQPHSRDPAWRRMEMPSANGYATALALALLMGALADDGRLNDVEVLSGPMTAELSRERIRGRDLVLPFEVSWGAGVMRNVPGRPWGPGDHTFGHAGWGGACAFADPDRRLGGAYVMNRQSSWLVDDPRPRRLIQAAYAAL